MKKIGEKVLVFAKIKKIIQTENGYEYLIIPDTEEEHQFLNMVVPEDCVKTSDEIVEALQEGPNACRFSR